MNKITQVKFTPKNISTKRVTAYARVSSGKDAMLQSLSAQVSYYSNLIQNNYGWEYVGVYADEAKTGTKESRPEFQRLLADCRSGKIDMVITKSISRFARNTITLLQTVRELKGLGIDIFFEEQNIHSMDSDGELMLTILASYAQEESLSASENQKWRIKKNFQEGTPWDTVMLGYRLKDGVFEIVPEEAETVRLIFSLYLEGYGRQAIVNKLNEAGILTRLGNEWHRDRIYKILTNERYAGNLLLQKTFRSDHLTKQKLINRGELPCYYVEEAHEAIIDRDVFDAVQTEIKSRTTTSVKGTATPFTGIIRCGICGKNYRRKTTPTGYMWKCSTYDDKGKRFCASKQIPEQILIPICTDIDFITALPNNMLELNFKDGHTEERAWQERSRRESWTEEKRQKARETTLRRTGKWQEQ